MAACAVNIDASIALYAAIAALLVLLGASALILIASGRLRDASTDIKAATDSLSRRQPVRAPKGGPPGFLPPMAGREPPEQSREIVWLPARTDESAGVVSPKCER